MSTIINADTSDGLKFTSDTSGEIKLQSAGTDIATVNSSGITMASGKSVSGGEIIQNAGPAFHAYMSSNQAISSATITKVIFNTEDFDTNSCYDNATNYRFTPTVAGYYQINAHIAWLGFATTQGTMYIYKNGSSLMRAYTVGSGYGYTNNLHTVLYANGSTDYFEIYARNSSAETIDASLRSSHFSAVLVRAA